MSMTTPSGRSQRDTREGIRLAILEAVADGAVLMGTLSSLARALGTTVAEFRSGLRELLEEERIAVRTEPRGQLTIRQERRHRSVAPAVERRSPDTEHWSV
jgi:hypothetical protein